MEPKRILLVDDTSEIHKDFQRILIKNHNSSLEEDERILFDEMSSNQTINQHYRIDSTTQGQEALEMVQKALTIDQPFALAFIDVRMPPGWDGIETIKRIWEIDPAIQMVMCSAYSDHSWEDIRNELGESDNLVILKKPFEAIEICQLAISLTRKWELLANLHLIVKHRTEQLENLYSLTQATLEATEEGIIALGLDGKILMHNQKFLEQWGITMNPGADTADYILGLLADRVDDSVLFYKTMKNLLLQPKAKNVREWRLKNGTILGLYAHPQFFHEQIVGMVYSFRDISERKELEQQLMYQATHDILTGLPNRALLLDRLNQAIAHAKRFDLNIGVMMLDLDSFKEVNDSFGHKAGDALLNHTAKILSEFVRSSDTVARLGGDEFVMILMSRQSNQNFTGVLSNLMDKFQTPCLLDGHEIIVTPSIGISIYPQDGEDGDTLIKNADAAMYYAKEAGRNRFQFYKNEFNQFIMERAELKIALAQSIVKDELRLYYQPLVDLRNGTIIGLEALLRWEHPEMGLLNPLTFIPIAEESGQIIAIGEWVLRTACAQVKKWHATTNFPKLKISINISVKQFRQKNFVSLVENVLKETELEPHFLELEITESLILGNVSEVIQQMVALKELGVRFAIDDFGTGYSSLSYLKHFPFDTVKIDKTFMDNISTDSNNASIVEAIIGMTRNMGIDVLAEGVENLEQVNFLKEHHSNQVQGYYYSRPLTQWDCSALLEGKNKLDDR